MARWLVVVACLVGCSFHPGTLIDARTRDGTELDGRAGDADVTDGDPIGGIDGAIDAPACPPGYTFNATTSSWYRYATAASVSWTAAQADCDDDGFGTHLVVIETTGENDVIDTMVVSGEPWLGMSDRIAEGTWRWVTGPQLGFVDWISGNPNGGTNQNCGEFNGAGWHDDACTVSQPFICECDGTEPDSNAF
jgi:Lectin C-type domain